MGYFTLESIIGSNRGNFFHDFVVGIFGLYSLFATCTCTVFFLGGLSTVKLDSRSTVNAGAFHEVPYYDYNNNNVIMLYNVRFRLISIFTLFLNINNNTSMGCSCFHTTQFECQSLFHDVYVWSPTYIMLIFYKARRNATTDFKVVGLRVDFTQNDCYVCSQL